MFMALDLPDTETRNKAMKAFYEHNMLTLSSGSRSIRLRPTLSMTAEEGLEFIKRMEMTFTDMFHTKEK
jgi:acetylornithine/succinyldiaminopimelate/putrescine aminotransferase